ncbi:MAG: KH domain-containing protein [Myxococcales bacterium]|nr:KH domain-containing protein [Myxococcales bacterium]
MRPQHKPSRVKQLTGGLAVEKQKQPVLDGALVVVDADEFDDELEKPGQPGDGKAESALEVLGELIERMHFDIELSIREDSERIVLDVSGEETGRVIGKKGQTLDALQFLVNKIVNRFPEGRRHVIVDSGDYRQRHDEGLMSMAERQAARAVKRGTIVTLEPMSPRDRRVIHLSLAKFPGIRTRSNGEGFGRRIQIIPARRR